MYRAEQATSVVVKWHECAVYGRDGLFYVPEQDNPGAYRPAGILNRHAADQFEGLQDRPFYFGGCNCCGREVVPQEQCYIDSDEKYYCPECADFVEHLLGYGD